MARKGGGEEDGILKRLAFASRISDGRHFGMDDASEFDDVHHLRISDQLLGEQFLHLSIGAACRLELVGEIIELAQTFDQVEEQAELPRMVTVLTLLKVAMRGNVRIVAPVGTSECLWNLVASKCDHLTFRREDRGSDLTRQVQ